MMMLDICFPISAVASTLSFLIVTGMPFHFFYFSSILTFTYKSLVFFVVEKYLSFLKHCDESERTICF